MRFVLSDTGGSQRIQQAGRLGAMMVIIGRATVQEGLPFHCLIPWKHIFPNQEILKDGTALDMVLQRINEESNEEFERRFRLYQQHVPDFVWEVENSRVAENILIEAAHRAERPPEGGVDLRFEERAAVDPNLLSSCSS
ncbi:MAG: uncharacterized protein KVP18_003853 [Porospora cf. gigantea A]|uniref:uncharacterized protein n=1 Tax=Porospora cf. gigantea A TaxID=2853593 RepID=UPI00355983AE|nr:MAG: hypothetical protein KVP18_003853 [Porospora cf. gigantea A]